MSEYGFVSEQIPSILCLSELIYLLWLKKRGKTYKYFTGLKRFDLFMMQTLGCRTITLVMKSLMKFEVCLNYDGYL